VAAHAAARLAFFGDLDGLRDRRAFAAHLAPLRRKNWFVYTKPPFAGPRGVEMGQSRRFTAHCKRVRSMPMTGPGKRLAEVANGL